MIEIISIGPENGMEKAKWFALSTEYLSLVVMMVPRWNDA
jgi:hypothetical protein